MAKWDKFRAKLLGGQADNNIDFTELTTYLRRLNLQERIRGSHHLYNLPGIPDLLDLQPCPDGKAKAYQVEQVREFIQVYNVEEPNG
jgi:hypothetical protein